MQRLISMIVLPLAALVLTLGGCGGKDPHTGTWNLDKTAFEASVREMMATQMPPGADADPTGQMAAMMEQMVTGMVEKTEMTITLNDDGTMKADGTFGGEEPEHHVGTWTNNSGTITMTIEGEDPATGTIRDGSLYVSMPNPRGDSMEMKFNRGG